MCCFRDWPKLVGNARVRPRTHGASEIGANQCFCQLDGLKNNTGPEENLVGAVALLCADLLPQLVSMFQTQVFKKTGFPKITQRLMSFAETDITVCVHNTG